MTDATPAEPQGECKPANANGRTFKHSWHWVWLQGQMTNRLACSTCGKEKIHEREQA